MSSGHPEFGRDGAMRLHSAGRVMLSAISQNSPNFTPPSSIRCCYLVSDISPRTDTIWWTYSKAIPVYGWLFWGSRQLESASR